METARPDGPDRDDDLIALEGLEAEFTELQSELMRVEQARGPLAPAEGPSESHD